MSIESTRYLFKCILYCIFVLKFKQRYMERFLIQQSEKENHYVITDQENNAVLIFEKGKFNETQKVTLLDEVPSNDFMKIPRIMREIGDWAVKYHKEKLF